MRREQDAYKPKTRTGMPACRPARAATPRRPSPAAAVQLEAEYRVPVEHHNPMELFATTVVYGEDGKLTVYDKTQGVQNVQGYLCSVFGYSKDDLRVVSPFVGGAFGSGLRPQYQVFLAVLAARELKRSVRVSLTRQQMFSFGHRPATWQRVALGATARRHARSRHPRGRRRDLAVRGLQRDRRQLVGPALPLRQRQARPQGRAARPAHADRHAGAGRRVGRVRRSSARWTSWPSSSASTRSSCG